MSIYDELTRDERLTKKIPNVWAYKYMRENYKTYIGIHNL